jgi:hypothetical protein
VKPETLYVDAKGLDDQAIEYVYHRIRFEERWTLVQPIFDQRRRELERQYNESQISSVNKIAFWAMIGSIAAAIAGIAGLLPLFRYN